MTQIANHVNIMGIRGIPAAHGGFETFAQHLALYLRSIGWSVTVYCQGDEGCKDPRSWSDHWKGIERVYFETHRRGTAATMEFDWKSVSHVLTQPGIDLVLGYNTALFNVRQRLAGRRILMNMDGIEWKRAKWSFPARSWFFMNEIIGSRIATVPIADHPEIARQLARRGCKNPLVIPYGADPIENGSSEVLKQFGLDQDCYLLSIARIEPENSILEVVRGFVAAKSGMKLMVLGNFENSNAYHREVMNAADASVIFPGAIYEAEKVKALRLYARAYVHGHRVGGTNPSLVEALGAGNAILAQDNVFNKWVAGDRQFYFSDEADFAARVLEIDRSSNLNEPRQAAKVRHAEHFQWGDVLSAYAQAFEHVRSMPSETIAQSPWAIPSAK